MPKNKGRSTSIDCTSLFTFNTNIPSDLESSASASASVSSSRKQQHYNKHHKHHKNHGGRKKDPKKQAAERREENWTRRKLQSSFYLHSSASHSFLVKRTPSNAATSTATATHYEKARYLKPHAGQATTATTKDSSLADGVVDWDVVQMVKMQIPTSSSFTMSHHGHGGGNIGGASINHDHVVDESITKCSICLDSFVAARITKCGHIYCYACILRHFHVSDNDHTMKQTPPLAASPAMKKKKKRESIAKCPCCFTYIHLSELKPVEFVNVPSPSSAVVGCRSTGGNKAMIMNHPSTTHTTPLSMTFHKCHRKKGGLVPYLPFQKTTSSLSSTSKNNKQIVEQPQQHNLVSIRKRIDPNDIPSVKSPDAPHCRFNYIDHKTYLQHLQNDITSLQHDMQIIIQLYQNMMGNSTSSRSGTNRSSTNSRITTMKENGNLDKYFITMALEAVQLEYDIAMSFAEEQMNLMNEQESRYANLQKVKVVPYYHHQDHQDQEHQDQHKINHDTNNGSEGSNDKKDDELVVNKGTNQDDHDDQTTSSGKNNVHGSPRTTRKNHHHPKQRKANNTARQSRSHHSQHLVPGTTYLDNDSIQFYQAADGQLCFLCGFNLKCLAYEFMDKDPTKKKDVVKGQDKSERSGTIRPPFPDIIHGQIIDVETIHVTPDIRRRMPFTSHLPLYIDIHLVEINLTQSLSPKTRDNFRSELEARKKKRQAIRNAERKAKKKAEREEQDRIDRLKEGMQRIDVNDEFFHPVVVSDTGKGSVGENEEEVFFGDSFGPAISTSSPSVSDTMATSATIQQRKAPPPTPEVTYAQKSTQRSYGSVCAASNGHSTQPFDASNESAFPSLGAAAACSTTAFPSLSSSLSTNSPITSSMSLQTMKKGNSIVKTQTSPLVGKSSSKKKSKVVLFSTGGRRSFA